MHHGIEYLLPKIPLPSGVRFSFFPPVSTDTRPNAVALALASVSIGLFLHCHYFWDNIFHLAAFAVLGKIVSLIAMIGSLVYRHYKGNEYEVVDVARNSETLEELVVYRALYGERGLWVRPRAMFTESVELEGRSVPRFQFVGPM